MCRVDRKNACGLPFLALPWWRACFTSGYPDTSQGCTAHESRKYRKGGTRSNETLSILSNTALRDLFLNPWGKKRIRIKGIVSYIFQAFIFVYKDDVNSHSCDKMHSFLYSCVCSLDILSFDGGPKFKCREGMCVSGASQRKSSKNECALIGCVASVPPAGAPFVRTPSEARCCLVNSGRQGEPRPRVCVCADVPSFLSFVERHHFISRPVR